MGAAAQVIAAAPPAGSQASLHLPGAYFRDCYLIAAPDAGASALETYLHVVRQTPVWVNRLMALRNRMAALVGLKNLGHLGALHAGKAVAEYRVGDRVGIFTLLYLAPDEVLLGDSDKHLDVVLSVCKAPQGTVSVTTVVHVHNWLGRLYMLPVTPLHKIIVRTMLKKAASPRAVRGSGMPIGFRRAIAADIPAMSAIRLAVRENTLSDPGRITRQMYEDHLERLGRAWVCERDGAVIGFSCAAREDNSIWALFVDPGHEGLGAGKQLLQLATGWLFAQGAPEVTLSTAAGTRADRFYLAQGWQRGAVEGINVSYRLARSERLVQER